MILTKETNKFGNRLKSLRLQSGLTQAQLADKLNISPSTVGMYEQGRREPDNSTLTKLCHELKVSVDYLLGTGSNVKNSDSEIDNLILDFIDFIESRDGLTFDGIPLTDAEKKKITSALKVATAVSILEYSQDSESLYKDFILKL
jgi:Predicted transcriptional regulators